MQASTTSLGHQGLDVGAEYRAVFGGGASRITIVCAIDNPLSERRIENPARALGDEDCGVAGWPVVATVSFP